MAKNNLSSVITLVNNGKKYPVVSLVKENPEIAAAISKLVQSKERPLFDRSGNTTLENVDSSNFKMLSSDITEKSNDSDSIIQMFPEMALAKQILVSSVISPKDMSGGDVIFNSPQGLLSAQTNATLINKIKDYFEHDYKLKPLLPIILGEILFGSGSYPMAVIPESSIDDIINGVTSVSTESMKEFYSSNGGIGSLGILGNINKEDTKQKVRVGLEQFSDYQKEAAYDSEIKFPKFTGSAIVPPASLITVVDNPFLLKVPSVIKLKTAVSIQSFIKSKSTRGVSLESHSTKINDAQIQALMYKSRVRQHTGVVKVSTQSTATRNTIGKPLTIRLPSESIIPVHIPGNEKEHVGFFVLIDLDGNPLNKKNTNNHFGELQSKIGNGSTMSSYLTDKSAKNFNTGSAGNSNFDSVRKLYSSIIESDLTERLRNGIYGNNVTLGKNDEVYRIMLARTLSNQGTQLLYLPAELVTYFAYKYDDNGIGKSLLADMSINNSLRAMIKFSRVMASLKNSIGRTDVKLKLDEMDPDPTKTIETAIHEITKTRQQYFPLGVSTPSDLVDWIQRSGFEFTFEGHPKLPDMNIQFNEKNSNFPKPDVELSDELKRDSIMGVGLSPESVDNAFTSEFATTVVQNNIMMAKNVTQIQEHIGPQITDHARKQVYNDGFLMKELKSIITAGLPTFIDAIKKDEDLKEATDETVVSFLLQWFTTSFEVSLPQPNTVTLENQMKSFDLYVDSLDKALDAWINDKIINQNMSGNTSSNIENIKGIIKAYYIRKWMAENNIFTELAELTSSDENGKPAINLFDMQKNHINGLVRSITKLTSQTLPMGAAADKDLNRLTGGAGIEAPDAPDAEAGSFGDDIAGLGSDLGGDQTDEQENEDQPEEDPTTPKKDLPDLGSIE